MLMTDAMLSDDADGKDKTRIQTLYRHPSFKEWTAKHGIAFRKRMKGQDAAAMANAPGKK